MHTVYMCGGVILKFITPELRRLGGEGEELEFEASLCYIARPYLRNKLNTKRHNNQEKVT